MSAQSDVPTAVPGVETDPAMERRVLRRAGELCRRAEPHTDLSPCATHLAEAKRQLLSLGT